jgi:ribonuclease-3
MLILDIYNHRWRKTMNDERKNDLEKFQEIIGMKFKDIRLLDAALTHSSYANQYSLSYNHHNERLEFLGDSVLSIIVSEYLYKKYKTKPEGKLTKIRASIVCEGSLAETARKICIDQYIRIGKGEELSGGRHKDSMLADACEAVIASIYMDQGYDGAKEFILCFMQDIIEESGREKNNHDYKTALQEKVQKLMLGDIKYEVIGDWGPDHEKTFQIQVSVNGKTLGSGEGKSKKEAQQSAAREALKELKKS